MELKVGDKVRFLNEKGGGIVTRILSNNMVNVAIEEGFDLPVLASDLIKIEPAGMAGRFFDRHMNLEVPAASAANQDVAQPANSSRFDQNDESDPERVSPLYRQSGVANPEGLFIIYIPQDQKILITGKVDIYLINNTRNDVLYSFLLREQTETYSGVDYDVIPPFSKIILETIDRDDIEGWSEGIVQALFHREESGEVLAPLHASFKVKPVRFYKESNYQDFRLVGQKALVVLLGDIAGQMIIEGEEALKGVDPAVKQKVSAIAPPAFIDVHKIGFREAEVDLHISELKEQYAEMSNSEILRYQLDYFSRMLDSAISNNYYKVVFIHGIGNGTLKSAIIAALADYDNVEFRTAPFAKYGNGAVEIIIHRNS
ncbi:MAG: DNA mismatch repair [Bacteroidetes bacterium]|nr:MAG: DNA mismatch repair [Bacteroidota bacterium]